MGQYEDFSMFIGRPIEGLKLSERWRLTGKWVALEIYTPERLPMRILEAVGDSVAECAALLANRGLDPTRYEYLLIAEPY
jgi:hypothetical protein